jgi:hypothetical protein
MRQADPPPARSRALAPAVPERGTAPDPRLILAMIVVLAAVIRFVDISSRLSIDDAYSWLIGSAPSAGVFLHRLAASENSPPLFYLLLVGLPVDHIAWLRAPAAVPGVLMCVALYGALARPLGARVALLASLAVAVAPLLVTYSDLARGFMLEDLALLIALGAMLRLLEEESRRWWAVYLAAGVVAIYAEFDAAIFLIALAGTTAWLRRGHRLRTAALGLLPVLALAPWTAQIVRSQNAVGVTKLAPTFAGPSPVSLRDVAATLAFGEHGGTGNSAGRWGLLVVFMALAVTAAVILTRTAGPVHGRGSRAIVLLAAVAALTLAGHALAGALGIDLFNERYLTVMIPLVAALGATAILGLRSRRPAAVAAVALAILGVIGAARRYGTQFEPSLAPAAAAALAADPATVLTNTPVVVYYLRGLHPVLDRPYNLGPGRAAACARPCVVVDDTRVPGGTPRRVTGRPILISPFIVTVER